jgi:hypothetical protein
MDLNLIFINAQKLAELLFSFPKEDRAAILNMASAYLTHADSKAEKKELADMQYAQKAAISSALGGKALQGGLAGKQGYPYGN